jgi:RNA polymerase primary sigma factor
VVLNQPHASLDEPAYNDSEKSLYSVIAETQVEDPVNMDLKILESEFNEMLLHLKDRERIILKLRLGLGRNEPMTLKEVSESIGLSLEATWQAEQNALKKIRNMSTRLK